MSVNQEWIEQEEEEQEKIIMIVIFWLKRWFPRKKVDSTGGRRQKKKSRARKLCGWCWSPLTENTVIPLVGKQTLIKKAFFENRPANQMVGMVIEQDYCEWFTLKGAASKKRVCVSDHCSFHSVCDVLAIWSASLPSCVPEWHTCCCCCHTVFFFFVPFSGESGFCAPRRSQ